jgi:hypothetical protein
VDGKESMHDFLCMLYYKKHAKVVIGSHMKVGVRGYTHLIKHSVVKHLFCNIFMSISISIHALLVM